ncbi:major capsid protein [Dipodfec virus UA23Rod_1071]|uniref:Major capsid protein n=1 Tax=Dipodfec virus UA23Rod_1071 TaxID=2929326 RepID=A0A976N1S7_9VIRU|nr:major capsid protein [Dipodfec virus UA23Rod_1071]
MDRNEQTNFFSEESTVQMNRSMWTNNFNTKTTFNNGYIIPFYANSDILPGMTIKNRTSLLIRMTTPKYPTMDTLECDTFWFKVPWWTIWKGSKQFFGENEKGAWAVTTELTIPKIVIPADSSAGVQEHDVMAYMGIPQGLKNFSINALNIRAYCRVFNYWFRNQNVTPPIQYTEGNENVTWGGSQQKDVTRGGTVLQANRFFDYFAAALPQPQKGTEVTTPLGTTAPVTIVGNNQPIGVKIGTTGEVHALQQQADSGMVNAHRFIWNQTTATGNVIFDTAAKGDVGLIGTADLTKATAATINALRMAFATQRILEKDARFGTMYQQVLRGHFGVNSPNASLHIPEYLGGAHFYINIDTVLQNSQTSSESPLGETGAYSVSFNHNEDFTKSFDEHCVLLGLLVVRARHTYQQGVQRQWTRTRRLDLYWPSLAHIGNQPIYNYELYAQGNSTDNQVFGYKEAWSEYKYYPSLITGQMSSLNAKSLDSWHYGDHYSSLPTLSPQWMKENSTYVNRTLVAQSPIADQFIADINVEQTVAAPMPIHSTPGLIDHF